MADSEEKKQGDAVANSSTYIRTYAKDMAAAAGRATPDKLLSSTPKAPAPDLNEVVLPKTEEPFFSVPEPKEVGLGEESLDIPSKSDLQEFVTDTIEQPRPDTTPPPLEEAISTFIPESTPEPAPEIVKVARESILARLRRKMGEHPAAEEPVELVPPPAPIAVPEPEYEVPTPSPAEVTPPEAAPERLHTYDTDFADKAESSNASAFSVLAAQQDAHLPAPDALPTKKKSPVLAIVAGILFILVGSGGVYGAYWYFHSKTATPVATLSIPSLVTADEYEELSGNGAALLAALAQAANEPRAEGTILVTYVKETVVGTATGTTTQPAPGGVLIQALALPAPDILLRNISRDSTVGIIHSGSETRAFFVLRVDSYERTFAGMLAWENWMAHDLALLYPLYPTEYVSKNIAPVATTTIVKGKRVATTTPAQTIQVPVNGIAAKTFIDGIVSNHDVRLLKDTNGKTLMVYGYADKQTLIIARDESAFAALLTRLVNK